MELREKLAAMADLDYQAFHAALVPTVLPDRILGVRLPQLRRLAKEIARESWQAYLETARTDYYEEQMLYGLVIAYAPMDWEDRMRWVRRFVPLIDNWAVCDSVCSTMKWVKKHLDAFYPVVMEYLKSDEEYQVRFALVILMDYYIVDGYVERIYPILETVRHDGYYARMAAAWLISVLYVKNRARAHAWLAGENALDDFTYHKALRKILESNRVSREDKAVIRSMKRTG